jgi:secondary thiamine-phosphate synthase enzyme
MKIYTQSFTLSTEGFADIIDITAQLDGFLRESGILTGILTVFIPGSTAGISTIEYEPGAVADLKAALERLAPQNATYQHNRTWDDGNGFSHVRAALIGPSQTVPVENGQLSLGTWQQVVVIDCDNRRRTRKVQVHILGE